MYLGAQIRKYSVRLHILFYNLPSGFLYSYVNSKFSYNVIIGSNNQKHHTCHLYPHNSIFNCLIMKIKHVNNSIAQSDRNVLHTEEQVQLTGCQFSSSKFNSLRCAI